MSTDRIFFGGILIPLSFNVFIKYVFNVEDVQILGYMDDLEIPFRDESLATYIRKV